MSSLGAITCQSLPSFLCTQASERCMQMGQESGQGEGHQTSLSGSWSHFLLPLFSSLVHNDLLLENMSVLLDTQAIETWVMILDT